MCIFTCCFRGCVCASEERWEKSRDLWSFQHHQVGEVTCFILMFCWFERTAVWTLICICFFPSVLCLKDTQCACITWKTSVQCLMGLLHTGNGLTTTGRCTMAVSPTRDLDRWVLLACILGPSVTLCHNLFVISEIPMYKMSRCVAFTPLTRAAVWQPTWVNVEFWILFLQTHRISHGR